MVIGDRREEVPCRDLPQSINLQHKSRADTRLESSCEFVTQIIGMNPAHVIMIAPLIGS